ncbi:unnamed protein product [Amoebophrya sp. A25]|nr:unnamed protein product [Amoebophrya sp. A25]|eukprot:GSA25T00019501001.1
MAAAVPPIEVPQADANNSAPGSAARGGTTRSFSSTRPPPQQYYLDETPRYKSLGFQGLLNLAHKANPVLIDTAAGVDDYETLLTGSKHLSPKDSTVDGAAGFSGSVGDFRSVSTMGGSPKGGKKRRHHTSAGSQSVDVAKLERQLSVADQKTKQQEKRYKEEKKRASALDKEMAKLRERAHELQQQLTNTDLDLSSLRKERELDRRAFEADCKKKEAFLKKLLLAKKDLLEENFKIRPRTASMKAPGGIFLEEQMLERRPLSASATQLSKETPASSSTHQKTEIEEELDFLGLQPAAGKSGAKQGVSSGAKQQKGGGGEPETPAPDPLVVSADVLRKSLGSNLPSVLKSVNLSWCDTIVAPLLSREHAEILLEEFKRIDQRFFTASVDRREIARMQAEVVDLSEKISSITADNEKAKDATSRLSIVKKKLEDGLKRSKSVASKMAERNGLEEEQNQRVRDLVRKHESRIEQLMDQLKTETKSRDVQIKELQTENSSLRKKVMELEQTVRDATAQSKTLEKEVESGRVEVSLLEEWRTRSGQYFREKYDYESTRISALQNTNKKLQTQMASATAGFDRYCERKARIM